MKYSSETNKQIFQVIFNPELLKKIKGQIEIASVNYGFQIPTSEFAPIQWQLLFPHVIFALEYGTSEEILSDFCSNIYSLPNNNIRVRVGDYINADNELSILNSNLGLSRLFLDVRKRKLTILQMSNALLLFKTCMLSHIYHQSVPDGPFTLSVMRDLSEVFASCVAASYLGRAPRWTDEAKVDAISETICCTLCEIKNIIDSNP